MRASNPDECPLGMWLLMVAFLLLHVVMAWVALRWLPEMERAEARTTSPTTNVEVAR